MSNEQAASNLSSLKYNELLQCAKELGIALTSGRTKKELIIEAIVQKQLELKEAAATATTTAAASDNKNKQQRSRKAKHTASKIDEDVDSDKKKANKEEEEEKDEPLSVARRSRSRHLQASTTVETPSRLHLSRSARNKSQPHADATDETSNSKAQDASDAAPKKEKKKAKKSKENNATEAQADEAGIAAESKPKKKKKKSTEVAADVLEPATKKLKKPTKEKASTTAATLVVTTNNEATTTTPAPRKPQSVAFRTPGTAANRKTPSSLVRGVASKATPYARTPAAAAAAQSKLKKTKKKTKKASSVKKTLSGDGATSQQQLPVSANMLMSESRVVIEKLDTATSNNARRALNTTHDAIEPRCDVVRPNTATGTDNMSLLTNDEDESVLVQYDHTPHAVNQFTNSSSSSSNSSMPVTTTTTTTITIISSDRGAQSSPVVESTTTPTTVPSADTVNQQQQPSTTCDEQQQQPEVKKPMGARIVRPKILASTAAASSGIVVAPAVDDSSSVRRVEIVSREAGPRIVKPAIAVTVSGCDMDDDKPAVAKQPIKKKPRHESVDRAPLASSSSTSSTSTKSTISTTTTTNAANNRVGRSNSVMRQAETTTKPISAVKKPDFKAIHSKEQSRMESVGDYLQRKQERMAALATAQPPRPLAAAAVDVAVNSPSASAKVASSLAQHRRSVSVSVSTAMPKTPNNNNNNSNSTNKSVTSRFLDRFAAKKTPTRGKDASSEADDTTSPKPTGKMASVANAIVSSINTNIPRIMTASGGKADKESAAVDVTKTPTNKASMSTAAAKTPQSTNVHAQHVSRTSSYMMSAKKALKIGTGNSTDAAAAAANGASSNVVGPVTASNLATSSFNRRKSYDFNMSKARQLVNDPITGKVKPLDFGAKAVFLSSLGIALGDVNLNPSAPTLAAATTSTMHAAASAVVVAAAPVASENLAAAPGAASGLSRKRAESFKQSAKFANVIVGSLDTHKITSAMRLTSAGQSSSNIVVKKHQSATTTTSNQPKQSTKLAFGDATNK